MRPRSRDYRGCSRALFGRPPGADDEILKRLDTTEHLLRAPASLAHSLQAAPAETLEQVGAILAQRTL